ncbi:dihydrodipicolinate synthase family protein [Paenibacillus odorifer]|uniref:dihydrodipicolinate synthase family protein n=1 Tax=Paenibacillus odorifer TaxID=189426 RepID=UPI00096E1ADD|nr:dihydrodipicolinate synthase family protein [Paenibacillus odorifer]OMD69491.1 dihydrodipicolinate synthase family protein [Paenibacillus odorifer]
MTLKRKPLTTALNAALHDGLAIPAHPLALTKERKLDERRQRALTRYYLASGAGGVAVAVHSTQFEIRDPEIGLLEPVLRLAAEEVERAQLDRPFLKVAGICGGTEQAVLEARLAVSFGYEAGLLSMGGLQALSEEELLERARRVAEVIPVFGFYLQPSVGGRILSFDFWKAFAEIEGVIAIKMAPFNRYQTLDVVRAVLDSSRSEEIALYTGNDDNIVSDLLTTFRFMVNGKPVEKKIVGGLLGHWAVWTSKAVQMLNEIKKIRSEPSLAASWLTFGAEVTDSNAALFDPAHHFQGCIPGIHEVLRRQGLLEGLWCLNPEEQLSPGQMEEINRVYKDYPHLLDDEFVAAHLDEWLQ